MTTPIDSNRLPQSSKKQAAISQVASQNPTDSLPAISIEVGRSTHPYTPLLQPGMAYTSSALHDPVNTLDVAPTYLVMQPRMQPVTPSKTPAQGSDKGNVPSTTTPLPPMLPSDLLPNMPPFGPRRPTLEEATQAVKFFNSATAGSDILRVREQLTSKGISGKGITVAVIEPFDEKTGSIHSHTKMVQNVINGADDGFAPGATVKNLPFKSSLPMPEKDDINHLNQTLKAPFNSGLKGATQSINLALSANDPTLRVINISMGSSISQMTKATMTLLDQPKEGIIEPKKPSDYQFAMLRQTIYGDKPLTELQASEKMAAYISKVVERDPQIQQAQAEYQAATKRAADKGVATVVAMGNHHIQGLTNPGWDTNFLARSPYVISVAASDNNATPGTLGDDSITNYSSRGTGTFKPTLAAPTNQIITHPDRLGMNANEETLPGELNVFTGTSSSAPVVSATIANILQVNPNLTFAQIKAALQAATVDTKATANEEGAGILDPVKAVLQLKPSGANVVK
jgi:Subtilase family